jgi:hypothetical protein
MWRDRNLNACGQVGEFSPTAGLAVLGICVVLCGLSFASLAQSAGFRVHGIIRFWNNSPAAGAEVTFEGEGTSKSVRTDSEGHYETSLPMGTFTMTARQPLGRALTFVYRRPPFRVVSAADVSMNATFPSYSSCDLVSTDGHEITAEDGRNFCEGTDLYSIPSKEQYSFQLSIQYGTRHPNEQKIEYYGRKLGTGTTRVLVAYDCFTVQADHVEYDEQKRILEASGNVVVDGPDGTTQNTQAIRFALTNGEASLLP